MITSISKNKFITFKSRIKPHSSMSDDVSRGALYGQVHSDINLNKECVNTTIITTAKQQNACGRLSFKGGAARLTAEAAELLMKEHPVMTKLAKSNLVSKFFLMADKNAVVADAFSALFLTCVARPLAIMFMPHKKSDDEKNKKAASHSISSGLIGYAFAMAIFHPMGKLFGRIPASAFANPKNLNTFRQSLNYAVQIATVPLKAAVTVGLIPFIDKNVIGKIFGCKPDSKERKQAIDVKNPYYSYSYLMNFKGINKNDNIFKAEGVSKNANI